jgi:hypothetical protein
MNARTQITIDPELQRQAHAKAAELGISFAEYVRRLLAEDLGPARRRVQVSAVFDLVDEGAATHIARDKDRMVAEAVSKQHRQETNRMAWPLRATKPRGS